MKWLRGLGCFVCNVKPRRGLGGHAGDFPLFFAREAWGLLPCSTMLMCAVHASIVVSQADLDRMGPWPEGRPGAVGYAYRMNPYHRPGQSIDVGPL